MEDDGREEVSNEPFKSKSNGEVNRPIAGHHVIRTAVSQLEVSLQSPVAPTHVADG